MKKYEALVKEAFNAYQLIRGVEITDFTIHSAAYRPMHINVWLDYEDNQRVENTDIVLKEGTTWELAALVAQWMKNIDFDSIREGFKRWEELNSDLKSDSAAEIKTRGL